MWTPDEGFEPPPDLCYPPWHYRQFFRQPEESITERRVQEVKDWVHPYLLQASERSTPWPLSPGWGRPSHIPESSRLQQNAERDRSGERGRSERHLSRGWQSSPRRHEQEDDDFEVLDGGRDLGRLQIENDEKTSHDGRNEVTQRVDEPKNVWSVESNQQDAIDAWNKQAESPMPMAQGC